MNFKNISTILILLSLDLLVFSSPVNSKKNSTNISDIIINEADNSEDITKNNYLYDEAEITSIIKEETNDNYIEEITEIVGEENSDKPITVKSLNKKYPNINWKLYFEERFESLSKKEIITDNTKIYIVDELYFKKLNKFLSEVNGESLSYYFECLLPEEYSKFIDGIEEEYETQRSDYCYAMVTSMMDKAVARYFVENNFSPAKKQYADKVIEYIKQSMINRIPQVEWLDEETIEYAYKKVSAMTEMIGYRDYILNPEYLYEKYEKYKVKKNEFFTNMVNYYIFYHIDYLKYTNLTIYDMDMGMTPQIYKR
ncbi:hypothetical protein PIROE2DRAFT_12734 [Piromyces sp. E2]|nr:hypothetical protein PIROE2DRAFT_12734 [Piromyces sp. E2]|eukprot:OUM61313.1 hypothetical protein PIROE2DRAFT_12734 [Piromyces sp. E2]